MAATDLRAEVEQAVAQAQRSQDAVGKALLAADPSLLVAAAQDFQQAVSALSERVHRLRQLGPLPVPLQRNLQDIAQAIGMQREACLRRGALADQAVQSVLPAASATPVYGERSGPYGAGQRRSGAFKVLAA